VQCEPEFADQGRTAPVRNATFRVRNRVYAPAEPSVEIAGEDKALFLGKICIVIAQVEMQVFLREGYAYVPIQICRQWKAAQRGRLIAKPEIASAPGDCRGKVRPQQFARQVNADTKCGVVAPGTGVRVVWRDAGAGCKMQRLAKTSVGTCHKFPIVNVGHATDWWRPAAGVQIVTPTEIQIDISDLRTDTGAHRDLSRRIARELNACHAGAGVEMMERSFESSSDRWLMSG